MALQEIMGSRRQTTTATRLTVIRTWECLKTEVTNTGGSSWLGVGITLPTKGDALGYGTWTNKVQPRLQYLSLAPHKTRKKTYVIGHYGAPMCQGAAVGTRVEITDTQVHSVRDTGYWSGYRKWSTPDADITTNRSAVMLASWTVNGITLLPKRTAVAPDFGCPGTSIITAHFDSKENPYNFTSDKVRISIKTDAAWVRMMKDYDDLWVHGADDADLRAGIRYKPVEGSDLKVRARTIVYLKTAYARGSIVWDDLNGNIGMLNTNDCPNICNAKAKELILLGVDIPETFLLDANNSVIPIIFTLGFKKGGWHKDYDWVELSCAKFQRRLRQDYILHPSDTGTGTRQWTARDGTPLPGTDSGPTTTTNARTRTALTEVKISPDYARTPFGHAEAPFDDLNDDVYWGG
jgi:hypothetical protein